jgi:hypothetical protein
MGRLTAQSIRRIVLPTSVADKVFFDDALPGFGLRVRATGARTWIVQYAINKRTRRVTIGSTAIFSLAAARAEARKLLAMVRLGGDPAADKRAALPQA